MWTERQQQNGSEILDTHQSHQLAGKATPEGCWLAAAAVALQRSVGSHGSCSHMLPLRCLNALLSHISSHGQPPLCSFQPHPPLSSTLRSAMEVSSITQTAGFRAPVSYIMEALTNDKQVRDEDN